MPIYDIDIKFLPWPRVLKSIESGEVDATFPAYYSDERAATSLFSKQFINSSVCFYQNKGAGISYTKLEDLIPYRIGIVNGYINTPEFDNAHYLNKNQVNSDNQNILKLISGRLELIVIDKFVAQYIINTSIPEANGKIELLEPVLQHKPLYLMVSKKNPQCQQIIDAFNSNLDKIQKNNSLNKILKKHGFK